MKTSFLRAVTTIVRKDLRTEFRTREIISIILLFALLSILTFSFALELDRVAREEAISGVLWVTIIFSSTFGFNRSLSSERDQGSLDAMLLAPIDRSAIFAGKLIGNFLFTFVVGFLLLPIMTVLYNKPLLDFWIVVVLTIGSLGFATLGTLLATMTAQAQTREALLPIVILPIALPILLSSVSASTGILNNAPFNDWIVWIQIVTVVTVIYLVLCFFMFHYIVEE